MWFDVWNRLASSDNDDLDDIELDVFSKTFYQYAYRKIEILNFILNVLIASVCIFLLKVKVWQLPLIIIGVDIMFTIINTSIVNRVEKRHEAILNGYKSEKYLNMLKELRDSYKKECSRAKSCAVCEYSYDCRFIFSVEKRIKVLNSVIKSIEKKVNDVMNVDVVKELQDNKQAEALKIYKNVIENLKQENFEDLSAEHQKAINNSVKVTENLLKEVERNPSSYRIVQNTFEIYIVELINTITAVNKLDDDLKEEYYQKINTLVAEYNKHVDALTDRVQKYNLTNIDVNINTLLKEMKNDEGNGKG